MGGVIAPNDGECHMSANGEYTHSQLLDYPSISQINLKVKENSINVIFAVTAQQTGVYEKLSKHIEGSTSATLSEDSSNVVELVKQEYNVCTIFKNVPVLWLNCVLTVHFFLLSIIENFIFG